MKLKIILSLVLAVVLLVLSGCASMWSNIEYDLDDVEISSNKQLKDITLDVRTFDDVRNSVPENAILFSESYDDYYLKIGEKEYCINKEYIYTSNEKDVSVQISTLVSEHLKQRGAFKSVTTNGKDNQADYYLTGKIMKLYGQQEYVQGSKGIAMAFGVIGALGTMAVDTPLLVEIEYADLAIYKNDGQLLAEIGNIHERFEEKTTGGNDCKNTYLHINEKLIHVNDILADKIENVLISSISR